MHKFNINREDLYRTYRDDDDPQRTRQRLTEMAEMGMEEVGVAEFGVPDKMSGLYIERVWNYSDKQWKEYMEWAAGVINKKQTNG
jgi:hypothetical protein